MWNAIWGRTCSTKPFQNMKQLFTLMMGILFLMNSFAGEPVTTITRENAPENAKWRLTDIYISKDAWSADLGKAGGFVKELAAMKGTLSSSSDNLLHYFTLSDEFGKISTKLYCYAYLQRSLDSRDPSVNDMLQRIQSFMMDAGQQLSWVEPELVAIPEAKTMKWIEMNPAFEPYRFSLENMYRLQNHVLPAEQEQLVSYFNSMAETPSSIYTEVAISDNVYPEFIRSSGDTVLLSRPMLTNILNFSNDRSERERAYTAFSSLYKARENTMAAILHGVSKNDKSYAQAYRFNGTLEAALNGNNIPVSVYENLVKVAKENSQPLQRYIALRKKVLKLDTYAPWDGNMPLGSFNRKYTYDEAKEVIRQSLKPLGKEYNDGIDKALDGGWIDVYEGAAKETGAYSMPVYGVHPYILLNYDQTTDAVSTMSHELGHTMHSMFSSSNQPFKNADYSSFVAEVASNFNEEMLLDYLLANASGREERVALLDQAINNLIGSFYRQSQFADFELQVHRLTENGQPVNATVLNGIMHDLNTAYYGNTVIDHPFRDNVWTQIMHFYNLPYYVYNYATSYAAAARIHELVTKGSPAEREKALQAYLKLLKSGGNNYPVEQLRIAGVDMTTSEPTLAVVKRLNELIDQLEKELQI